MVQVRILRVIALLGEKDALLCQVIRSSGLQNETQRVRAPGPRDAARSGSGSCAASAPSVRSDAAGDRGARGRRGAGLPESAPAPACSSLTSGRPSPPGLLRISCHRSSRTRREAATPGPPGAPRSRRRDCMGPGTLPRRQEVRGRAASRESGGRRRGKGDRKWLHGECAGNSFPRRDRLRRLGPARVPGAEEPTERAPAKRAAAAACEPQPGRAPRLPTLVPPDAPHLPPGVAAAPQALGNPGKARGGGLGVRST
jgi:hypothetical protein